MEDKGSILVIDDEPELRECQVLILRRAGYRVRSAADGAGGLRMVLSEKPDLVLCDVMMPGMDGFRFAEMLREMPSSSDIPLIFVSGRNDQQSIRQGMNLGADDFIIKPFDRMDLLGAVESRMKRRILQLERQREMVSQARLEITASLPHELMTPLSSILGFSYLLENVDMPYTREQTAELGGEIRQSGERLLRLLRLFLLYTEFTRETDRRERLQQGSEPERAGLKAVLGDTARAVASRWNRSADLQLHLEDVLATLPAPRLQQMVEQLLDNAFKFSQAGTAVVVTSGMRGNFCFLQVRDHGRGMTEEQIAAVGPFRQFNRELHEQQGLGLGLAIVKMVSAHYGGSFQLSGADGTGGLLAEVILPGGQG